MSYAKTYGRPHRDPRGIALTIAVHGAVVAAVLLAPAMVIEKVLPQGETNTFDVPIEPPPPPPEKETVKQIEPQLVPRLYAPKPIIERPLPPIDTPRTTDIDPGPIVPPATPGFSGGGTGGIGNIVQPRVAPPVAVLVAAIRDPRYAGDFQPPYPPGLLRRELEGSVKVRVLVGPDGRVSQVRVVQATHPDFARETQRQAKAKWRFKPATEDGVPVPSWQTLTVRCNA